jgi:hypothetical protein
MTTVEVAGIRLSLPDIYERKTRQKAVCQKCGVERPCRPCKTGGRVAELLCAACERDIASEIAYDAYVEDRMERQHEGLIDFADPGGRSALRAETGGSTGRCDRCNKRVGRTDLFCKHCGHKLNPRVFDCPDCGGKGRLTAADKERGYRCDECADAAERGIDGPDYWED